MSNQGLLYLPHSVCTLLLLHANNKGADQPTHPRSQLALESMIQIKKKSTVGHVCADPDNSNGGGGFDSRGKFVPVFSSWK